MSAVLDTLRSPLTAVGGSAGLMALVTYLAKDGIREWWAERKATRIAETQAKIARSTNQDRVALELIAVLKQDLTEQRQRDKENGDKLERIAQALESLAKSAAQQGERLLGLHEQLLEIKGAVMHNGKTH